MTVDAPPWAHVVGRLAASGCRTARGTLRFREPAHGGDGRSSADAVVEGTHRFWFAAPGRWRIEDDHGLQRLRGSARSLLRDDQGRLQALSPESVVELSHGDPALLLGTDAAARFTGPDAFSVPLGPATAAVVAGRAAWEFVLAPPAHKEHPLRVAVDDATGTVLRLAVPEVGAVVEMTSFEPDVALDDDVFAWDGPVATDWADERREDLRRRRWLHEERLPVPRWWPDGVLHQPLQGDPETGAFSTSLEVPGGPDLARWPRGGTPPRGWRDRSAARHVHRWEDDGWVWELAVDEPLTDDDLARVVASIAPVSPWCGGPASPPGSDWSA